MENEHQLKGSNAVWLGSKGRHGSFHLWINVKPMWQVKLCDPSLTHATSECLRDKYHS